MTIDSNTPQRFFPELSILQTIMVNIHYLVIGMTYSRTRLQQQNNNKITTTDTTPTTNNEMEILSREV